eukprot:gene13987-biopygen576
MAHICQFDPFTGLWRPQCPSPTDEALKPGYPARTILGGGGFEHPEQHVGSRLLFVGGAPPAAPAAAAPPAAPAGVAPPSCGHSPSQSSMVRHRGVRAAAAGQWGAAGRGVLGLHPPPSRAANGEAGNHSTYTNKRHTSENMPAFQSNPLEHTLPRE